jgi:manganese efflux pump family protein
MDVETAAAQAGQLMTVLIMSFALGLDAFSLGVGIGMRGIRRLDIVKLSFVIGLFHIVMPLLGMIAGYYVSTLLGNVATFVAGGLLLLLGGHMIYSSMRGGAAQPFDHRTLWGILVFALSVSIDSFSVGVSLGMFATDVVLTVLMFGIVGGVMSVLGLSLGRKVSYSMGEYGEAFGGVILFVFGLLFIL